MSKGNDPLAQRRRRRDELRDALARATRAREYAVTSANGTIARARQYATAHPGELSPAVLDWMTQVQAVMGDPGFGGDVNVPPRPYASVHSADDRFGSTVDDWAAKARTAAVTQPALTRNLQRAQAALDAAVAGMPTVPEDSAPTMIPAPQNDEEAVTMIDAAHASWLTYGSGDEFRCGAPKVGHGVEGQPCRNVLGPDGVCEHHP